MLRFRSKDATLVLVFLTACQQGAAPDAGKVTGPAVRLELSPAALLLPSVGATGSLQLRAYDAEGNEVDAGPAQLVSSGGNVTVTPEGVVTAVRLGTERVTATVGALSARATVLVAVPVSGAVLVSDAQVVGEMRPIDPAATFAPGYRYQVRLVGVAVAVGDLVIGTGDLPVGGRVAATAGDDVTLELVPLDELFPQFELDETLTLADEPLEYRPDVEESFDITELPSGEISFALKQGKVLNGSRRRRHTRGPPSGKFEFDVGPLECAVETSAFQLTLAKFEFTLDPGLTVERKWNSSSKRVVVTSNAKASFTVKPTIQAQLEGKLTCELELGKRQIPLPGPVGLVLGFAVPFGIGFELEAKVPVNAGVSIELKKEISATIHGGFTCTGDTCMRVADFTDTTPPATITPKVATWDLPPDLKVEASAYAYAFAKLEFGGSAVVQSAAGATGWRRVEAELLALKVGLKLDGKFADQEAQARDPMFAGEYKVLFEAGLEPGSAVQSFISFIRVNLTQLELKLVTELATSPKGTLQVVPATFVAGDALTFNVSLQRQTLTFPLIGFNANRVRVYKKTVTGGLVLAAEAPVVAGVGQLVLTGVASESGDDQGFVAFIETNFLSALTCELERLVAPAMLTISPAQVLLRPGQTQQFVVTPPTAGITWSLNSTVNGSIDQQGLFTAGPTTTDVLVFAQLGGVFGQAKAFIAPWGVFGGGFNNSRAYENVDGGSPVERDQGSLLNWRVDCSTAPTTSTLTLTRDAFNGNTLPPFAMTVPITRMEGDSGGVTMIWEAGGPPLPGFDRIDVKLGRNGVTRVNLSGSGLPPAWCQTCTPEVRTDLRSWVVTLNP